MGTGGLPGPGLAAGLSDSLEGSPSKRKGQVYPPSQLVSVSPPDHLVHCALSLRGAGRAAGGGRGRSDLLRDARLGLPVARHHLD